MMPESEIRDLFPYVAIIPEDEYHRAAREGDRIGSHQLADFRSSPILFHKKRTGEIERSDSAAFQFGRALHKLVLEGKEAFDGAYVVCAGPVNPKTGEPFGKLTKAYKEWASVQPKEIVSPEDFAAMEKIAEAVWCHPVASKLLADGFPEGTLRVDSCGLPLQARLDWFVPFWEEKRQAIVDLKTCESLDNFPSDARRFGYPNQLMFYHHCLFCAQEEADDRRIHPHTDLYIIAVEKREPFRVGVWKMSDDLASDADAQNLRAMDRLRGCIESDEWPTNYEDLRMLDVDGR